MKGIDISGYQAGIDLAAAKKEGYDFAIIYAGMGNVISQKGQYFDSQMKSAIENGFTVGAYWFSYALNTEDARKEADVCAAVIQKWKDNISLPVFFDWEYDSDRYAREHGVTVTKALLTELTIAFIERMKAHGYEAGYYTNLDYMSRLYDYERMKAYPLWLAQYEGEAKYPYKVRQTSSNGNAGGVQVDTDIMDGETKPAQKPEAADTKEIRVSYHDILPAIAKEHGTTEDALLKLNGVKKSDFVCTVRIPGKTIDQLAKEVIAGEWGSWPFRSLRLKAAGYDADAVQARVNEILKK